MGITKVEPGEGIAVLENVDSVNWFKYMFRMDYEEQGFSKAEVKEILKEYADGGEFFHRVYHPVKGFISGLLDVTIIKPAIEAVIGIDLITQEELTAFERGMQGVDALIGIVTLGQGAAAARTAQEGIFKTVFKTWATDAISDTAAYTVGSICDENGVPICISLALSGLTGCTVSKKTGKYLLTDEVSGVVTGYTAEEVQSLLKRTGIAEVTGEGADLLEELAKNSERIIDSVKREPEVLETVVKKGGSLGNAVAGKKALTEGVIAKTIGNIDGLTDAVKTGGKSIDATQQAVKGIKATQVIDGVKSESEVLETAVKKGGVLGNAVAGKKALTEGVIAKTVGNIDGLTDAAKKGGKSIDATQQAVKGIKTADVTDVVRQVEVPENTAKTVEKLESLWRQNDDSVTVLKYGRDDSGYFGEAWYYYFVDKYGKGNVQGTFFNEICYMPTSGVALLPTEGKTTTILGRYDMDTSFIFKETGNIKSLSYDGHKNGFNLLNVPDELSNAPNIDFWNDYNVPFLDEAIGRGDVFALATEPNQASMYRVNQDNRMLELSGFGKEIKYLESNGYIYDKELMQMIPNIVE